MAAPWARREHTSRGSADITASGTRTPRTAVDTARQIATRVLRVEQPEERRRSWPELRETARKRREVADWITGANAPVEPRPVRDRSGSIRRPRQHQAGTGVLTAWKDGWQDYGEPGGNMTWKCAKCGEAITLTNGEQIPEATRRHSRRAAHAWTGAHRTLPSGTVQRWLTPDERADQAEKATRGGAARERTAHKQPHQAPAPATGGGWTEGPGFGRLQRKQPRPVLGNPSPAYRQPQPEGVPSLVGLAGLATLISGFTMMSLDGETGWCLDHPDDEGHHMRASRDCPSILADATAFETFAGYVGGWLVLGGVLALIAALMLYVAALARTKA